MKIFLVEDEVFALRILQKKITDLQQGYEIVGTATDGTEALPKILASDPAVVITDIRMNDMDGLTLVEKMQEHKIAAIPVIVSGYQEFEYAKQAMKLGVKDYLLKPVELSELRDCLERCRQRLETQYSQKNIHSFLIGNEAFHLDALTSDDNYLLAYTIFSTPLNSSQTLIHPGTGQISGQEVHDFCAKHMPDCSVFCFDGIFSNEKVLLFHFPAGQPDGESSLLDGLTGSLAKQFGMPVTTFVTLTYGKRLTYDIQTARRGCIQNVILGENGCYRTFPPVDRSQGLSKSIELFSLLLQQNDQELLLSNVLRLCQDWKARRRTIVACQTDLVFILNSLSQSREADIDSAFFVENLLCFSASFEELAQHFGQLLFELFGTRRKAAEPMMGGTELVQKIEDYLQANLSRSITLQDLTDEMQLSKVYLCRIFKKYKNSTPIDYFNRMKIERACELLKQFSSLPLQEISDRLGFNDVYYFSKVFKKITGVSPSGYRKNLKSEEGSR